MDLSALSSDLMRTGLSPFLSRGGSITVSAGRDLKGAALGRTQNDISQWWWRSGVDSNSPTAWWSRYDLFSQGIATFGGGDVRLSAGRDAVQVHAASASNGWRGAAEGATSDAVRVYQHGGGSVMLNAGRDITGGRLFATGSGLDVTAGGAVTRDDTADVRADAGLQLVYGASRVALRAGGNVDLGAVRTGESTVSDNANTLALGSVLGGLSQGASLSLLAGGDLRLRGEAARANGQDGTPNALESLLPDQVQILAPKGNVQLDGGVVQAPQSGSPRFDVLAAGDVLLSSLTIGAAIAPREIGLYNRTLLDESLGAYPVARAVPRVPDMGGDLTPVTTPDRLDASDRSPVRLSAGGDLTLRNLVDSVRPVDFSAGRDIVFGIGQRLAVQQQDSRYAADGTPGLAMREMSVLQAGRDIKNVAIEIAGPGDLLVMAGRDVDLGANGGLVALGAVRNSSLLPTSGSNITVVAGLRADGADYRNAVTQGFELLGSSGWQGHLGAVYQALGGTRTGFDTLAATDQLAALRQLLGSARMDAGLASYVQSLPARADATEQRLRVAALLGKPANDPAVLDRIAKLASTTQPAWSELTPAQALAAFAALPTTQQAGAITPLLTAELGRLDAASRRKLLLALAPAGQAKALGDYVRGLTAVNGSLSDAQALVAFEALPLAQQIPWLNQQLVAELRHAGRAAAETDGDGRWAAYASGYQAVNLLFPLPATGGRPAGELKLPTSQIKTLQQADITLLAPGGGANAGEIVASGLAKKATDLGIVTVNGGSISAVVQGDFAVNQSRVFTLAKGDLLLWSGAGNIDAGRGAKTVTGAPAPVLRLDSNGNLVFDTSGSFSGSGIAVLSADSNLDLFAPAGEINAGEAGIRSKGNAFLAADRVVNAIDIQVAGKVSGGGKVDAPAAVISAPVNTALGPTSAGLASTDGEDDDKKKRRRRRNLLLEFLGFGGQ